MNNKSGESHNLRQHTRSVSLKAAKNFTGDMSKCHACEEERITQIHHEDYSDPYLVAILCTACHAQVHRRAIECPPLVKLPTVRRRNGTLIKPPGSQKVSLPCLFTIEQATRLGTYENRSEVLRSAIDLYFALEDEQKENAGK